MTALHYLRERRARKRGTAVRLYFANSVEDIQSEVLRCAEDGERLRPIGGRSGKTDLGSSDENLLSLHHMRGAELAQIERRRLWVRPGTPLVDLIGWLARHELGIGVTPDYPGQTLGAAISTGSPARLSDAVLGLRMVHADGHRTSYSIERDHGLFDAMRVSLGVMGVITQIELRCTEPRRGWLQRRQVSFSEALSTLEAADAVIAQRTVTWFANAPAIVEEWDDKATPTPVVQLYEQARGVVHDALGTRLLCGLAASLPAGARWSDSIGVRLSGSAMNGTLPIGAVQTARRIVYSIPAADAAELLLRLRDLWRSLRFPVYAPIRIEFAAADAAWLSPAHERDSALVSFPCTELTSKEFVDSICALLEAHGGRPCWGQMRPKAAPPTIAQYPRLADFGALRRKIDRRGVFLNRYLSSLFGLPTR